MEVSTLESFFALVSAFNADLKRERLVDAARRTMTSSTIRPLRDAAIIVVDAHDLGLRGDAAWIALTQAARVLRGDSLYGGALPQPDDQQPTP